MHMVDDTMIHCFLSHSIQGSEINTNWFFTPSGLRGESPDPPKGYIEWPPPPLSPPFTGHTDEFKFNMSEGWIGGSLASQMYFVRCGLGCTTDYDEKYSSPCTQLSSASNEIRLAWKTRIRGGVVHSNPPSKKTEWQNLAVLFNRKAHVSIRKCTADGSIHTINVTFDAYTSTKIYIYSYRTLELDEILAFALVDTN